MNTKPLQEQLSRAFYIRVTEDLLEAIDELVEQQRREDPGRLISRSDVARRILAEGTHNIRKILLERKGRQ